MAELSIHTDPPPQIRWNLDRQVWEVHAVVLTGERLADVEAEFPSATIYKPQSGWPLDRDHPIVIAAKAATDEYEAMYDVRAQRWGQADG